MKFFTNKQISKKIVIAIVLVMSFNFISPTVSQASANIGVLFQPLMEFLCTVADLVLGGLQGYFVGNDKIAYDGPPDVDYKEYHICYSPGIIFSNKVAGLKTNFINASSSDNETVKIKSYSYSSDPIKTIKASDRKENQKDEDFFEEQLSEIYNPDTDTMSFMYYVDSRVLDGEVTEADFVWTWTHEGKTYSAIMIDVEVTEDDLMQMNLEMLKGGVIGGALAWGISAAGWGTFMGIGATIGEVVTPIPILDGIIGAAIGAVVFAIGTGVAWLFGNGSTKGKILVYERNETITEVTKESSALFLKDTVATWYKALRAIALVGLLSILVYVGIRILISSTGQEKAKYKKMLIDWLAALCLLFVLHYIMLFITDIVQKIINVLAVTLIGPNGEDILITSLRQQVMMTNDFIQSFAQTIMYLVLTIHTVIFTIQYLKRFFYLAFFTMIAPLVALTYPLDKIKDGKAQAFSIWLKEYIFNSLLQPMHLLLYVIFVDSAINLVLSNPLYAIVAIGFLVPAEKFFRKMFGFEQASSASPMAAAAGGALIMNAINKIGQSGGKHAAGSPKGSEGAGSSGGGSTPRYVPSPNSANGSESASGSSSGGAGGGSAPTVGMSGSSGTAFGETINTASQRGTRSFGNGARTLAGHYFNKGNLIKGAKGLGRTARKIGVGAVGAATLGTVGLAAGIATGDASNAFSYGLAGAGVGYAGANALGDKATAFEKKNREIFKEGALGTEEYNTRGTIQELTRDNDFNNVCNQLGIRDQAGREALIRQFHSNGITSSADIKKAINAGASTNNRNKDQLIAAAKIRKQATQYGMKRKEIEEMIKNRPNMSDADVKKAMDLIDML